VGGAITGDENPPRLALIAVSAATLMGVNACASEPAAELVAEIAAPAADNTLARPIALVLT